VKDYLIQLGISERRIRTISYGENQPIALGHNEEAWRLNRRAEFEVIVLEAGSMERTFLIHATRNNL